MTSTGPLTDTPLRHGPMRALIVPVVATLPSLHAGNWTLSWAPLKSPRTAGSELGR